MPLLNEQGLPTGEMSAANDDVYHWHTVSPRVGVNYRVNASGTTLLKAHYGRYYKALEAGEFRPAVPSITPAYSFTLDSAGNRTNIVRISSNANLRIDPDFKSAYSDQYIVQLEQEVMKGLGLQVNYVHKSGEDYGGWEDIAGQYVQVPYVDSVGHRRDRRDGDGLSPDQRSGGPDLPADQSPRGSTCATTASR